MVIQTVKKPIGSKRKVLKPTVTFKMIETRERETLPSEKTKNKTTIETITEFVIVLLVIK